MIHTPVLISGGGPVGLCAAIELGLRGIRCVIVEPRPEPTRLRPRAKTLNTRTMEHFRRWGLADRIRAQAPLPTSWSSDVAFRTTLLGREITRFSGVLGLGDEGVSPELGQQMPQYVLEGLLRDVVADLPSCALLLGSRVVSVADGLDHAVVGVRAPDGTVERFTASYVIGADGARSAVREAIGASYVGSWASRPNLGVTFRCEQLLERAAPAVQSWLLNDRVPGMMGPVDLDGTWWLIAFGVDGTSPNLDSVALVHGALGERLPVEIVSTDPWTARMELADRVRDGRIFLVGDAAHLNPPFGGHGLNTGIGDAVDLGWKLAAVLDGWGGPGLLDSYEAERRAVHERVVDEATANMSTLAGHLVRDELDTAGPIGDAARAAAVQEIHATKRREYYSLDLVLGHGYQGSAVIAPEHLPGAPEDWATRVRTGHRLPHAWLEPGLSTLDRVGPGYTVFTVDGALVDGVVSAAEHAGVPLSLVRWQDPTLAASLGADVVVVRPDQVVAWHGTGQPQDPAGLLDTLTGRGTVNSASS
ncbi:FAD-dependent monooxygenase [Umezawaea sp. Da 62-37]|uniref:FAD-dependent monooxygenase n=1 Tax=Umezawaea sp. Da 62-37 TaxID=3075927 RepID=UPI0028F6DADE|nr:FAD-dependent monooxygenase [Umezawaea sp. Da 62-37]WNV83004.1 FAD-dependent monooxygenase [Umezawaea sp. Da 62-37]